jgi:hypothetical protein
MGISTFPAASAGGITARTLKEQVFNASGTWTYPTSSNFDGTVWVTAVGGGGAGGSFSFGSSGNYPVAVTGGGGGGRVLVNQEVNVYTGGNQTVTIGAGGHSNISSGFGDSCGGYSMFGSPVVANYYPDPNMRRGVIGSAANRDYADAYFTTTPSNYPSFTDPYPTDSTSSNGPKTGGVSNEWVPFLNSTTYSLWFPIQPSKNLDLIFQYTSNGTSGTITPVVKYYNSTNTIISSDTCASYTVSSSGTTFTTYKATGLASPANAVQAQIVFTGGTAGGITGLTLSPTSLGLTQPISGNSSGYGWSGSPQNSWTVKSTGTNLKNFLIAQGGGAGWGFTRYGNGSILWRCNGDSGWTSGGHSVADEGSGSIPTSYQWFLAGHGGGAGGDAITPDYTSNYTMSASTTFGGPYFGGTGIYSRSNYKPYSGSANRALFRPYVGGGLGTTSTFYYTGNTNQYPIDNGGKPGSGINGLGNGGIGAWYTQVSGMTNYNDPFARSNTRATTYNQSYNTNIEPNTGNGGHGIYAAGNTTNGQHGSSGLVIVRWYE